MTFSKAASNERENVSVLPLERAFSRSLTSVANTPPISSRKEAHPLRSRTTSSSADKDVKALPGVEVKKAKREKKAKEGAEEVTEITLKKEKAA